MHLPRTFQYYFPSDTFTPFLTIIAHAPTHHYLRVIKKGNTDNRSTFGWTALVISREQSRKSMDLTLTEQAVAPQLTLTLVFILVDYQVHCFFPSMAPMGREYSHDGYMTG